MSCCNCNNDNQVTIESVLQTMRDVAECVETVNKIMKKYPNAFNSAIDTLVAERNAEFDAVRYTFRQHKDAVISRLRDILEVRVKEPVSTTDAVVKDFEIAEHWIQLRHNDPGRSVLGPAIFGPMPKYDDKPAYDAWQERVRNFYQGE